MSESFVRVTRRAVHSVKARGFHERAPALAHHSGIMAQLMRLTEEVGELARAVRKADWVDIYGDQVADSITSELADVFVVLANVAWMLGVDPTTLETSILAKLAADEERGWLHQGNGAGGAE